MTRLPQQDQDIKRGQSMEGELIYAEISWARTSALLPGGNTSFLSSEVASLGHSESWDPRSLTLGGRHGGLASDVGPHRSRK